MSNTEIKLAIFDVDGTLTNGIYQMDERGVVTKSFYTRDFHGMMMLAQSGVDVVIMTQARDNVMPKQMGRICQTIPEWEYLINAGRIRLMKGVDIKWNELMDLQNDRNINVASMAFIGDAENDIDCLKTVGFPCCPKDAISEVREICLHKTDVFNSLTYFNGQVSGYKGGEGAVYDICKRIIEHNKILAAE